jgi:nucleoside phosphorylase
MPPPDRHPAVTDAEPQRVVIVTALDLETNAVLRHLGEDWREEVLQSGTICYRGTFEAWDVIVVEAGAGNVRAATTAADAIKNYRPDLALFVGIAGGVKDVGLADVVIATKVYNYESGRDTPDGFLARAELNTVAHELQQRARAMMKRNEWRRRLDAQIDYGAHPKLFVGAIAAGEKVVAGSDTQTANLIKRHYSDALAVEMEGSGFFEATNINRVVATVIRGISDLLDDKTKTDKLGLQAKAADAASAVAFEMLSKLNAQPALPPEPVSRGSQRGSAKVAEPVVSAVPARPAFVEMKATLNEASFFDQDEILARVGLPGVDEIQFRFQQLPHAYVRVIPTIPRTGPIPNAALLQHASPAPLLKHKQFGALSSPNGRGAMAYDPGPPIRGGLAPLSWGTQLFPNGEVWLASNTMIIQQRGNREAWVPIPFIPALLMEQIFYEKAHGALGFAQQKLGLKLPCNLELGVIDLKGVTLALYRDDLRPILTDKVILRRTISTGTRKEIDLALLDFFNAVYDATGYARPPNLFGFPPGPPQETVGKPG